MKYFFENVKGLGHVAVSRHAQDRMVKEKITEAMFVDTLHNGRDTPDSQDVLFRDGNGIRLVILLYPKPNRGARLVKSAFRIVPQARPR